MAAGPMDPGTGRPGPGDPTMPAHPGAAAPVYAPPPDQRFDRSGQPYAPQGFDPQYAQHEQHRDRGAEAAAFARRHIRTPETKEFFKTSEFLVWALTFVTLMIAGAASDLFDGGRIWVCATVISAAYIVSRGIAKAGSRRAEPEGQHWGHDHS